MIVPQELKAKVTADRKVMIPFPESIPIGAMVKVTYNVQVLEGETPSDFATLETLYQWDDEQVLPFLTANPPLVGFLIEARPVIKQYFDDVMCELEIDHSLDEGGILNLFVVVDMEPPEVLEVLEKFDAEWWIPRAHPMRGKLSIHTRFSDHD